MAKVLVRATDGMPGHLKGDPVTVQEDGVKWGNLDTLATWVASGRRKEDWSGWAIVVNIPDASVASLRFLMEPDQMVIERDDPKIKRETGDSVRVAHKLDVRARRRKLDIDSLPDNQTERTAMLRDGEITKTRTQVDTTLSIRARDTVMDTETFDRVKVRDPSITR